MKNSIALSRNVERRLDDSERILGITNKNLD